MFSFKLRGNVLKHGKLITQQLRNLQVSLIGAGNEIGANVALLLKQNPDIKSLRLHDNNYRVLGIGVELDYAPGGASVSAYAGDELLEEAMRDSNILVLVSMLPRQPGFTREQMFSANAPFVRRFCQAIYKTDVTDPFIAISTNPLNMTVPLASALLHRTRHYNPYKLLGMTHIDSSRIRAFAGNILQVNPVDLDIPVIGGHSEETIIPLFSNIQPNRCYVDQCQADMLTRLVRKAGTEIINHKHGTGSSVLAMAWSINDFLQGLINAAKGESTILHCYTANPHFGTNFFAGPATVSENGIVKTDCYSKMNGYENELLKLAIPYLHKDVTYALNYADLMKI